MIGALKFDALQHVSRDILSLTASDMESGLGVYSLNRLHSTNLCFVSIPCLYYVISLPSGELRLLLRHPHHLHPVSTTGAS